MGGAEGPGRVRGREPLCPALSAQREPNTPSFPLLALLSGTHVSNKELY